MPLHQPPLKEGKGASESPNMSDAENNKPLKNAQSESKGKTSSSEATRTRENEDESPTDQDTLSVFDDETPSRVPTPVTRPLSPKAKLFKRDSGDEDSEDSDAGSTKQRSLREQRILKKSSCEQQQGTDTKKPAEGDEAGAKEKEKARANRSLPQTPPLQTDLPIKTPMAPKAYYKRAGYMRGLPLSPRVRPMRVVSGPSPLGESDLD